MKKYQSVLFTHDDLDGAGCHVVFAMGMYQKSILTGGKRKSLTADDDQLIVHCSNANIDEMVKWAISEYALDYETAVYFADIVPSREILEWMKPMFPELYIFDHHRTNFWAEQVIPNAVIVPENNVGVPESGTSLLYHHFCSVHPFDPDIVNEGLLDLFVDKVRSYDTWEWKAKGDVVPKHLQLLLYMLGMKRFCASYGKVLKTELKRTELFTPTEQSFIDARMENEQNIITGILEKYQQNPDESIMTFMGWHGHRAVLCITQTGANISELASQFLEANPDIDIYIGFSLYGNGEFSFRTRKDDIDLGKDFALPLGGGGHRQAAGAVISDQLRSNLLDMLKTYLTGNESYLRSSGNNPLPESVYRILPWFLRLIHGGTIPFDEDGCYSVMPMTNSNPPRPPVFHIFYPDGQSEAIDISTMLTAWTMCGNMTQADAERCWNEYKESGFVDGGYHELWKKSMFYLQVALVGPLKPEILRKCSCTQSDDNWVAIDYGSSVYTVSRSDIDDKWDKYHECESVEVAREKFKFDHGYTLKG